MTRGHGQQECSQDQLSRHRTIAEWTTMILSSLLIAAVVGAVTYFAVTSGDQPPAFQATPQDATERAGQYYLPVTVTNVGDEPAQEVRVRVDLRVGEATETATFTIELLAAGASEVGTVVFTRDPAQGALHAVVESYL